MKKQIGFWNVRINSFSTSSVRGGVPCFIEEDEMRGNEISGMTQVEPGIYMANKNYSVFNDNNNERENSNNTGNNSDSLGIHKVLAFLIVMLIKKIRAKEK